MQCEDKDIKIVTRGNRIITRKELFKKKEEFHKKQAELPYEEKIRMLFRLQEIASNIQKLKDR